MSFFRRLAACLLIGALCAFPPTVRALAQTPGAPVLRDGRHDFDFNLGVWHTRITRILDPFAAVKRTMAMSGTVTVRPVWG
ncbi:MAG: hypothetical protein JO164_02400, partial [Candidatus Eremiobacteraeota bacterium]|nr:hypothetical protein [Candidatus Eremiobacteraeota bacterium]